MAFFMTVGRASPGSRHAATTSMAGGRGDVADVGAIDVEFQREMREDMRDAAGAPPVGRNGAASALVVAVDARRPVGGRHFASCRRAGPCPARLRSRTAPSPRTATKAAPRRCGFSAFARADGQQFRIAGGDAPRQSSRSGQSMQRGRFGVQIVAPRSIIACAKSPGRSAGTSVSTSARGFPAWRRAAASRIVEQPRHDALDIAVDHRGRPVEGDRRDRRRRVGADAGQLAQARPRCRESAAGQRGDDARRMPSGCAPANNSRARPRPS